MGWKRSKWGGSSTGRSRVIDESVPVLMVKCIKLPRATSSYNDQQLLQPKSKHLKLNMPVFLDNA